ncbi:MAG TPA: nucleoside phosphorylase [Chitinophagales bacterium]|nr:nucleoside phosphorylase [Chitinophagales bacterium]HRK26252.1 nucleoside phosphorylase [Chitinophagales bacterium]
MIAPSELVLNADGSIYHLHLLPHQIAKTIITVGDPDRVAMVSLYFDELEHRVQKREFVTHTGRIGNKRLTVISTGIGTDNIDIVLNEIDALVNIDLPARLVKPNLTSLNIIRLGTSGSLQPDVAVESLVASSFGLGLEGLLHYYRFTPNPIEQQLLQQLPAFSPMVAPYIAQGSPFLLQQLANDITTGITATCGGFYGPQGRQLRLLPAIADLPAQLQNFSYNQHRVTNFEMETAAIYGLCRLLGHRALSVNVILANRPKGLFSQNPKEAVGKMIQSMLARIITLPDD